MVQYYAVVLEFIHQMYFHVNIAVNIMFVNSLPFLVRVYWRLKYTTTVFIKIRKWSQLVNWLTKFTQLYVKYDFVVNFINGDNKFEAIRNN